MEIIPVSTVDEVIANALTIAPVPIEWSDPTDDKVASTSGKEDASGVITH